MQFYAEQNSVLVGNIEAALAKRIPANANDDARKLLHTQLKQWDWEAGAPWAAGTPPNSASRRKRIYELLEIGPKLRGVLDDYVSHYEGPSAVLVEAPDALGDWYTSDFRAEYDFYFKRLRSHLAADGIPDDAINSMDSATSRILERLGAPWRARYRAARGLVVGYVQSGKTTNFTGVIAKAIDAGYRLIIVLSGTTNLLRNQSQRRLDMALVGVENILRSADEEDVEHDYKDDNDWPDRFVSYGKQPSLLGNVDIVRVTGQEDFQSTGAGINQMDFDFEKVNKQRPLYEMANLAHTSAKLVVVKKQRDRLGSLLKELRAAGKERCSEVPTLIIDDESDQASVNTLNPQKKTVDKERTKINLHLVELLKLLPRAQYIGYTATPFANVLVKPDDPADIYPRDFILSLQRPENYMGARDFHDFVPPSQGHFTNEEAYIRSIPALSQKGDNRLLEALDSFVLSGALKKFRTSRQKVPFKHHTMLVHHSHLKGHHELLVDDIRQLWSKAGYDSPGAGQARLKHLLENDFRKVWLDRGKVVGLAFPDSFAELKSHLGAALDEMRTGDPVLMVNSAEGADVPDFDKKSGVWKIIVGGSKLSRGYTVEGLTISYFRRSSKTQDTLMQMGRWFGYREGYRDLVRLFIGREEPVGKRGSLDLYKAFETICRDEESFREQLAIYEKKPDGSP
jgi:hypothetical protein